MMNWSKKRLFNGKPDSMKIKNKSKLILFLTIAAVAILPVVSCKTARPYQQPATALNDKLYRDAPGSDTATIAAVPWQQLFSDTLLQKLIAAGISNNLDLKIAVARIKAAAANFKQSRLALLPNIDANAAATFQRVPPTQFGVPEAYQLYINASWEADIWGKLGSARRAAYAALLQSDAYKRTVQTQLVADIAAGYYSLMAYDAQLLVTEKTLDNRMKEVETMKALKEANVVTGAAVVQSEANRYSVEITIPDLKQSIRETENSLSVLLGKNADTLFRSTLEQQPAITNLATGVPAQLLANRPDVQQAEYQFRNAFELVNVARTYFYPTLNHYGRRRFVQYFSVTTV